MQAIRALALTLCSAAFCSAATFGTVVARAQSLTDLVVDEVHRRIYVSYITASQGQVDVYSTVGLNASSRPIATIRTGASPLSMAISRDNNSLYVACYDASSLDVFDLRTTAFSKIASVSIPAKPQGVAVGLDGKVLISTIGTGTGASVLTTYDPSSTAAAPLGTVAVAPAAATTPQLVPPPANGFLYLASKARLQSSADGKVIVGVHVLANNTRTVFVYDTASATVLGSRNIAGNSPVLAVSADGSKFLSGPLLFESSTMLVLAQQNTTNSPYVMPGANFSTQTTPGGAAFLPDGSALLAAYNIAPLASPALAAKTAQLTINSPDTMLIQTGIVLPENLTGRLVLTSDGATGYAVSQSGFTVIPYGTLRTQPMGLPDSNVALLATDQCGVTADQNSAVIPVRNIGGGRLTVSAQAVTTTATTATIRTASKTYGGDVTAQISAAVARTLGTAAADQVLVQAAEAVNIFPTLRVFQNSRNTEAHGTILPIDWGAGTAGLTEMLTDTVRQRLYIANPGLNRIEVFDMQKRQLLAPIAVGQLPRSMAFGTDGNTMYVANSGGENISIVDLNSGKATGRVRFPPIPFNATFPLITPSAIAGSQRGPQVIMSDGTLWKIVGDTVLPRPLNANIFGTARSVPAPFTMASSVEGGWVLILAGNGTAFLYSASDDDFVAGRAVISGTITGYYGPIAAGANGQYFLVNDQILNQALVPIGSTSTGPVGGGGLPTPSGPSGAGRPVDAVFAAGATTFARYSTPITAAGATPTDSGLVEIVDVNSQRTTANASSLEGPATIVRTGQRLNVQGRSMALDPAGTTAFVLTASGISVIPLDGTAGSTAAQVVASGVVNAANFQSAVAPNGLIAIIGRNLASTASAASTPLPTVLGNSCVTLNNTPLPLMATAANQINAQLPPTLAPGRYPLVVRSISGQSASTAINVTVAKYAPAVFVDANGPLLLHSDGTRIDKDHPGHRDEKITLYTTGLGVTTGGRVTAGMPSPANPLAVTAPVNVYFGNPLIKEAGIIVDWSGLLPGSIGVYQLQLRIPGAHIKGDALPITVKIGGVSSPTTGVNVPRVWVE
jgi:uncharacterized protein (TIGR03437 family)